MENTELKLHNWVQLLVLLGNLDESRCYFENIRRLSKCSASNTFCLIKAFEQKGIIAKHKSKNRKIITLTSAGKRVHKKITELLSAMRELKNEVMVQSSKIQRESTT